MLTLAVLEPMAWPHPCGKHGGSAELRRLEILFKLGLFTEFQFGVLFAKGPFDCWKLPGVSMATKSVAT